MHKFYKHFTTHKSKKEQLKIKSELGGDNPVSERSLWQNMSNMSIVQKKVFALILAVVILIIATNTVYAACVTPTSGMVISSSATLCKGSYNLPSGIMVDGSNIILNGNGSTIYTTNINDDTKSGIRINKGNNNIIKNFNIKGYGDACITLTNYNNPNHELASGSQIIDNNLSNCGGMAGIYMSGVTNFKVSNNRIFNLGDNGQGDLGSHGIYLSGDVRDLTTSGTISYNTITNVSATGIKFNGDNTISNVKIFNNKIRNLHETRGDDIGIHLADAKNISVYNNDFEGDYKRGILLNVGKDTTHFANNNKIYDNSFNGLTTAIDMRDGTHNNHFYNNDIDSSQPMYDEFSHSVDNTIENNNYLLSKMVFQIKYQQNTIYVDEDTSATLTIEQLYNNAYAHLTFDGVKKFQFKDGTIKFTLTPPYNDIRNKNTGAIIASNLGTYSLTLSSNQQIEVGNFVKDPVSVNQPPVKPVVSIKSKDNTINSDINCSAYIDDVDSTSINTNIQWFKNGAITKSVSIDNKQPKTTVSDTLTKTELKTGDIIYCKARSYDGKNFSAWGNSATITITNNPVNQPPTAPVVSIKSKDNTINNDINCSAYIDDPNNNRLNASIQWYKNNVLNKSVSINNQNPKTTVSNILSKASLKYNDKWYCRVRAYDGKNFSVWSNSATITIQPNTPPIVDQISLYSYDSTVNNDILCRLNINDANNDYMNVSIHWYKNGALSTTVTKNNQKSGDVTEPLTKNNLKNNDQWQCRARVYDGRNYSSWVQSNTIAITPVVIPEEPVEEAPRRGGGGGGGGGGSTSPVTLLSEPVVNQEAINNVPEEQSIVEEPTILENPVSEDTEIGMNVQSANVEEPKEFDSNEVTGDVVLEDTGPASGLWLIGLLLVGILIFTTRNQLATTVIPEIKKQTAIFKKQLLNNPDQQVLYYILKKLNDGYSYEAIADVLKKKGYSERIIDYHNKILRSEGHQPHIKFPGPQRYSIPASKKLKLIESIQEYTRIHINEGFRVNDIKQVLLYNGHPMDLIEEAIYG